MTITNLRPSALAGQWYRANPQQLKQEVSGYMDHAGSLPFAQGEVVGLVAPHAGHVYSGPVAGHAFAAVRGHRYDTVAVLSPFHSGQIVPMLTTAHDGYSTPLGSIPVDVENLSRLGERLDKLGGGSIIRISRDSEHAIEIELPFLQTALEGGFKLLPLMLATFHAEDAGLLGAALADTLAGQNALLVASSDLSHFYPQEAANRLDQNILDAVARFDPAEVLDVYLNGKGQACGLTSILAVMAAARRLGASEARILHYDTSGTVSGDYRRVVGYSAAVFLRKSDDL
ncbi:MAG: AmmeMemoRadiSam system protein B [Anaerolineales bacterium]|nr:AmmeMemoRadiSam system protein B [Anaerolineales bacterium]